MGKPSHANPSRTQPLHPSSRLGDGTRPANAETTTLTPGIYARPYTAAAMISSDGTLGTKELSLLRWKPRYNTTSTRSALSMIASIALHLRTTARVHSHVPSPGTRGKFQRRPCDLLIKADPYQPTQRTRHKLQRWEVQDTEEPCTGENHQQAHHPHSARGVPELTYSSCLD